MITIQFQKSAAAFDCGEAIRGEVSWTDLKPQTESIEIRLIWYTQGKGDRDVGVAAQHPVSSPQPSGSEKFEFAAPNYPHSFSGKLISLVWAIEVIAFPSREAESREILIGPGAKEIVLGANS